MLIGPYIVIMDTPQAVALTCWSQKPLPDFPIGTPQLDAKNSASIRPAAIHNTDSFLLIVLPPPPCSSASRTCEQPENTSTPATEALRLKSLPHRIYRLL